MSVLKSRRKESSVQFLDTAREIEVYTIKQCSRFPKWYMFLLTKDLVELSKSIYNNTKSANSIYPTNKEEFLIRMEYIWVYTATSVVGRFLGGGFVRLVWITIITSYMSIAAATSTTIMLITLIEPWEMLKFIMKTTLGICNILCFYFG